MADRVAPQPYVIDEEALLPFGKQERFVNHFVILRVCVDDEHGVRRRPRASPEHLPGLASEPYQHSRRYAASSRYRRRVRKVCDEAAAEDEREDLLPCWRRDYQRAVRRSHSCGTVRRQDELRTTRHVV